VTDGNVELAQVLAAWAVTLPAVVTIIVRDERRLKDQKLERAWPPQSRDAAIFGLWLMGVHPLCVFVHFARTRRTLWGVLLGLLWFAVVVAGTLGAELGVTAAIQGLGL
jgi:ABC-type Co2+ transport system permease subunit